MGSQQPAKRPSPTVVQALHEIADRAANRAAEVAVNQLAASVVGSIDRQEAVIADLTELIAELTELLPQPQEVRWHKESHLPEKLRRDVVGVLTRKGQTLAAIATAVGRAPKDATVRRTLNLLAHSGVAERAAEDGRWRLTGNGRCPACGRDCSD